MPMLTPAPGCWKTPAVSVLPPTVRAAIRTGAGLQRCALFGTGNGVPPTNGIQIVNNLPLGGRSCTHVGFRERQVRLQHGRCAVPAHPPIEPIRPRRAADRPAGADANRVRHGISRLRPSGDLRGRPAIIVHGRADALLPMNFASRPYAAHNGGRRLGSQLTYVEVKCPALRRFPPFPGYNTRFVPLHYYFTQAINLRDHHLRNGTPLPPSQKAWSGPRHAPRP